MKRAASIGFLCLCAVLSLGWEHRVDDGADRVDFGKIYLVGSRLLVGEISRGIRVIEIRDPAGMRSVGYIPLEENMDFAVKGDVLYADNGTDLLVYDVGDFAHPVCIDTIPRVFAAREKPRPVVQYPSEQHVGGLGGCTWGSGCGDAAVTPEYDTRTTSGGGGTGQAGSMARFAVVEDFLYCIDESNLIVFDIRVPDKPRLIGRTAVGFGIETLFPYRYYLFIGSRTGMFIYDARDVAVPVKVSEFRHARACDPVVVENDRAYVTLRNGTLCGESENELHIVDISNVSDPVLLSSYGMESPAGLAVSDGIAYVCDGPHLRILDVRNEQAVREISSIPLGNTFDVIYSEGLLIVASPNGLYVYDVRDPSKPVRIGFLSNIS
ncbi:MAG: hypothetical protein QHI48_08860 [Bacteroidota bacterium]|nr:hypothetical protein [Bacteroidota bacterium]